MTDDPIDGMTAGNEPVPPDDTPVEPLPPDEPADGAGLGENP